MIRVKMVLLMKSTLEKTEILVSCAWGFCTKDRHM